ncbi:hypothetical protein MLM16_021220, partial [Escherichia coli]|nr:hypothetical protein [Escherichia coli]
MADFADITTGGRRTIEPWPPEQIRAKITTTIESSQTNRSTFLHTTYLRHNPNDYSLTGFAGHSISGAVDVSTR